MAANTTPTNTPTNLPQVTLRLVVASGDYYTDVNDAIADGIGVPID